jgi:uncharacterized protein YsxB (DUF464 family)
MVVAKFSMDEKKQSVTLKVKGHAGAAPKGHDTVCASSSILAYTVAQNVKMAEARGMLKYSPTVKLRDGDSIISCRAKDDDSYTELLHTYLVIQTGYQLLAHNYPQFIAVEMFGEDK